MRQILDQKFISLHVVGRDNGSYLPIPTVTSWSGLDERIMDKMYEQIKEKGDTPYYDLVILGWSYKSEEQSYRERQALLALESLGKIERKTTLLWSLDEIWGLPESKKPFRRSENQC